MVIICNYNLIVLDIFQTFLLGLNLKHKRYQFVGLHWRRYNLGRLIHRAMYGHLGCLFGKY